MTSFNSPSFPRFHKSFTSLPSLPYNTPKVAPTFSLPSCSSYFTHSSSSPSSFPIHNAYPTMTSCNTAILTPSTSPYPMAMGASKRKHFEMEPVMYSQHDESTEGGYYHESSKRAMFSPPRIQVMGGGSGRQRQESGSSVSSTSSWSSTSSYSSVSSNSSSSSTSSCPGLAYPTSTSASAAARYRASPAPRPSFSSSRKEIMKPVAVFPSPASPSSSAVSRPSLYDICDAIELHADLQKALKGRSVEEEVGGHDGDYELKFVFVAPNWLQDHVAKAKKAVSMKRK